MENKIKRFKDINEGLDNQRLTTGSALDNDRTLLDYTWRNGRDIIGIVAVELTKTKQWTAYIGVGVGNDEDEDINDIANWGTRLAEIEANAFFPTLKTDLKYKA